MTPDLLTTAEAAKLLRYDSKTLRKKVAAGIFRDGTHFYKPQGSQYRWIREGLLAYLRGELVKEDRVRVKLASGGR